MSAITPYIFRISERGDFHYLYTVGYYDPQGKWQPESDHGGDHDGKAEAAARVHYLNGGNSPGHAELVVSVKAFREWVKNGSPDDVDKLMAMSAAALKLAGKVP